jgi:DNA-binding NtrC family response regulator
VPPLRQRRSEIAPLAQLFVRRAAERLGRPGLRLDFSALSTLEQRDWPGNIRELRNVVEYSAVMCEGDSIGAGSLLLGQTIGGPTCEESRPSNAGCPGAAPSQRETGGLDMRTRLRKAERASILDALDETQGNQSQAARLLGISRRTLTNKLNSHRICRDWTPGSWRSTPHANSAECGASGGE